MRLGRTWENICSGSGYASRSSYIIKRGTRRITRVDTLSSIMSR